MKRLINTKLFCMLEKKDGLNNLSNQDMRLAYEEFAQSVTSLFSLDKRNVPSYFTMHYTRLELERLQTLLKNENKKKK